MKDGFVEWVFKSATWMEIFRITYWSQLSKLKITLLYEEYKKGMAFKFAYEKIKNQ